MVKPGPAKSHDSGNVIWQQDGAPPHYAMRLPRSDLTSYHYSLWGYHTGERIQKETLQCTQNEFEALNTNMKLCAATSYSLLSRCQICIQCNRKHWRTFATSDIYIL